MPGSWCCAAWAAWLQLRTVEHAHDGGLDHIVEVMPQRDLVAAQLLGFAVQVAAAHPGAEVARVLVSVVGHGKDVAFKNGHRDVQQLGVGLDLLAIDLVVAGSMTRTPAQRARRCGAAVPA